MKFTKDQRLEIGRQIYEGQFTTAGAAEYYGINLYTARDYLRSYKASINQAIPQKARSSKTKKISQSLIAAEYENLSKKELIKEIAKARINEERAKKGYIVKGDGPNKEFIILNNKNSK